MENMSDIMKNMNNKTNEQVINNDTTSEMLANVTGLNIPCNNNLTDISKSNDLAINTDVDIINKQPETPIIDTTDNLAEDEMIFLSPEDSKKLGEGVKINPIDDSIKEMDQKTTAIRSQANNDFKDIMSQALESEEDRLKETEEKLQDEEYVESIKADDGRVKYQITEERTSSKPSNIVPPIDETIIDDYDELIPSYNDEEDSVDPNKNIDFDESPDPENTNEFREYIKTMEHISMESSNTSVIKTIKPIATEVVPSNRNKSNKMLADQAFLNSITKFKKDNFGTVSVPLINSGFFVDIVGTGVVDLAQLYDNVNTKTTDIEYEISKMKTIIKNVVGTSPKVDQMSLRNMIHYQDYQLMSFGHICATLKEVEILANCEECGKPFRITAATNDLLMNMDEMREKADIIQKSQSIDQCSLMSTNMKITTSKGFIITLGYPSYAELIKKMNELKTYSSKMNQLEAKRFLDMTDLLFMIQNIILPNNVMTSNTYQNYIAITMISDDDMYALEEEYNKMNKKVIIPKFGVKKVTCPHCHKINTNISYNSLDELVFYHTQVSSLLKSPEN